MAEAHHILVVDDDARLRSLLQNFLSAQGYRVSVAANAAAARAADVRVWHLMPWCWMS